MIGVVLAGGRGTRLRPLTDRIPKALVRVAGRPMVSHQVGVARALGLDPVIVLLGDRGWMVEETLRGEGCLACQGGTDGPYAALAAAPREEMLVLQCDTFVPPEAYRRMIGQLRAGYRCSVLLEHRRPSVSLARGTVSRRPPLRYEPSAVGAYAAGVAQRLPAALDELIASRQVGGVVPARMVNVNTPAMLAAAERFLRGGAGGAG
jgi:molybdopterin-guanine dinucleotide biosynthesis protein A